VFQTVILTEVYDMAAPELCIEKDMAKWTEDGGRRQAVVPGLNGGHSPLVNDCPTATRPKSTVPGQLWLTDRRAQSGVDSAARARLAMRRRRKTRR